MKHSFKIAAVMGCAALLTACTPKEERREKAPVRVKTELVGKSLTTTVATGGEYVGVVEENQATAVSFTSMGTLKRMAVSEGQSVARGQLLAEIDDTQARHLLTTAEAQSRQAEDALQRYSQLHEQGSMTDAQWVEIQSKVEQARSQLAIARKNVSDCRLLAPVSGIIGRCNLSAGETAMPSQAVVTILDISTVKVKCAVPEGEIAGISPTTSTCISVAATGREYQGGRIEKGVQADALTHTYDVRVRVDNKGKELLPGMVASVRMGTAGRQTSATTAGQTTAATITLPLTSVQRRSDGSLFVWSISADSTAHRTPVTIGESIGNRIEITSGLQQGMPVVTEGYQKLSEGTKTQSL
ncbi:MAG: efflux RND transporter periplasmic adaptor subunit [Bacteroidales bacterium]|nr:efflux RND transporter periplasmic adaptor subunit [Bacteroidales bacterium]